jgi:tRNA nucleotidyltransferase (CCA-adding enzyme)
MRVYLVGGAVRDQLLGLKARERDWVVVGGTPKEMTDRGYIPVGKSFPVYLHPKTREEYALARTERKTGKGYKGFSFEADPNISLEQDLLRRDLTINAIAKDTEGNLYDPYDGQRDLERRVLRHVSSAFNEDPLRVLRVARFAARFSGLGFSVASETMALMSQIAHSGELDYLTGERVWMEMQRALAGPAPAVFFEVLRECNAIAPLLPELNALLGARAPLKGEQPCAVWALKRATSISQDPETRFAAIIQDMGKEESANEDAAQQQGIEMLHRLRKRLAIPNDYFDLAQAVLLFHGKYKSALELSAEQVFELLKRLDVRRKPKTLERFLDVCASHAGFEQDEAESEYPQTRYLQSCAEAIRAVKINPVRYADKSNEQKRIIAWQSALEAIQSVSHLQ